MKSVIFNAEEVRAVIEGRKTQFRFVCKHQVPCDAIIPKDQKATDHVGNGKHFGAFFIYTQGYDFWFGKCPFGKIGDEIFVKESFGSQVRIRGGASGRFTIYKADNPEAIDYESACGQKFPVKWKPAQHMKQERSRLTLMIKEIRVEKLADITPFDCVCEGVWDGRNVMLGMSGKAVEAFKDNWNATHKKPEEKFGANPWVWVINFEVVK